MSRHDDTRITPARPYHLATLPPCRLTAVRPLPLCPTIGYERPSSSITSIHHLQPMAVPTALRSTVRIDIVALGVVRNESLVTLDALSLVLENGPVGEFEVPVARPPRFHKLAEVVADRAPGSTEGVPGCGGGGWRRLSLADAWPGAHSVEDNSPKGFLLYCPC